MTIFIKDNFCAKCLSPTPKPKFEGQNINKKYMQKEYIIYEY